MATQKTCAQCKRYLPLSDFTNCAQSPNGKHSWCKVCKRKHARHYNQKPRIKQQTRKNNLRRMYGISLGEYEKLYEQQKGMCLLCGISRGQTGRRKSLCVDHDHKTGKIRGLLCNNCNRAIGLFGDNEVTVRRAAQYLEFHSG